MVNRMWGAISSFEDRLMKLAGPFDTGKVIIRFLLNVALFVAGLYVFAGVLWVFAYLIPDDLARDPKFDRAFRNAVGAGGAAYMIFGIWWTFNNANQFRKALKNFEQTNNGYVKAHKLVGDVSSGAKWSKRNDDLVEAILKSNTHPQIGIEKIKEILAEGVNINAKNESGRTVLSIAHYYEAPSAVKALLVNAGAKE